MTEVPWQGWHSYTLTSGNLIVQFKAKTSPFSPRMVELAKTIHGSLAPRTLFRGKIGAVAEVWEMEHFPGEGYLFTSTVDTRAPRGICKRHGTASPFIPHSVAYPLSDRSCSYYAKSWNTPQEPPGNRTVDCTERLTRLLSQGSPRYETIIQQCLRDIRDIEQLPLVLTRDDLSDMNILVDRDTGRITGIVD